MIKFNKKSLESLQAAAGIMFVTIGIGLFSVPIALIAIGSILLFDYYKTQIRREK